MYDARQKLVRYHISGSHTCVNHGPDKLVESYDFEIWRDGDRMRCDQFDKTVETDNPHHKLEFNTRRVLCINCVKPKHSVRYRDGFEAAILPSDTKRFGNIYMKDVKMNMIDIMSVGVYDSLHYVNRSENYQLIPGSQHNIIENNATQLVIDHKLRSVRRSFTISEGKLTATGVVAGEPADQYVTVATLEDTNNIYGLPGKIVYKSSTKQKPYSTVTQTFRYHKLDQDIDPQVFTLKGLRIKDGTYVDNDKFDGNTKLVIGGEIVLASALNDNARGSASDTQATQPVPVPLNPQPRHTWVYALACITLAAVGVILFRKALRRR